MKTRSKIITGTVAAALVIAAGAALFSSDAWARRGGLLGIGSRPGMGDRPAGATGMGGYGRNGMAGNGMTGNGMAGNGMRGGGGIGGTVAVPSLPTNAAPVTDDLRNALHGAYDEEVLARDTYLAVTKALGNIAPFANIARSEQMHIDAVTRLAANHGVTIETSTPLAVPTAPSALAAACALGVGTERSDIALYDGLLPKLTAWPDAVQVFTNLRAASQNMHLPAFSSCD